LKLQEKSSNGGNDNSHAGTQSSNTAGTTTAIILAGGRGLSTGARRRSRGDTSIDSGLSGSEHELIVRINTGRTIAPEKFLSGHRAFTGPIAEGSQTSGGVHGIATTEVGDSAERHLNHLVSTSFSGVPVAVVAKNPGALDPSVVHIRAEAVTTVDIRPSSVTSSVVRADFVHAGHGVRVTTTVAGGLEGCPVGGEGGIRARISDVEASVVSTGAETFNIEGNIDVGLDGAVDIPGTLSQSHDTGLTSSVGADRVDTLGSRRIRTAGTIGKDSVE